MARSVVAAVWCASLLVGGSAHGDDPTRPIAATRATDRDALAAVGLGQSRGDPRPVPSAAPRKGIRPPAQRLGQGVVFVNFDGAQLSSGWDDSTQDVTQISECAGSFAPYGEGPKREAVMQAVVNDWSAYGVVVTDQRPASGDYVMNMTGPSNPFGGGVLGIAPLDCDDEQTHNNITYAFHSLDDGFDASTTATTIGQEVAHSFGLEHVDDPSDIMNPFNAGGDPSFRDECIGIVQGGSCPNQHAAQCGDGYSQNSHQELLALFGPNTPDTQQPTVAITFPVDGQELAAGTDFFLMIDAADDVAVANVTLFRDGAAIGDDGSAPFGFEMTGLETGVYELYAVAVDAAGNEGHSDTVTIGIGEVPPPHDDDAGDDDPVGTDGGGTDEGEDGPSEGGDEGVEPTEPADDGVLPPGFGLDDEGQGCACGLAGRRAPIALVLLVAFAARRRRVTRSCRD